MELTPILPHRQAETLLRWGSGWGGGAHGDDERIMESSLLSLIQFLWYAVVEVAASE
jgi:hypothetical protein